MKQKSFMAASYEGVRERVKTIKKSILLTAVFCAALLLGMQILTKDSHALAKEGIMAYILEVDGNTVCVAASDEDIRAAVGAVAEEYSVAEGSTVSFDNSITVTYGYTDTAVLGAEEITDIIHPEGDSEFALKVRTVVSETHREVLPAEVECRENDRMYEGEREVLKEGEDGIADITEKVVYVNGAEVSRVETSCVVVEKPVCEIVSVGTMYRPAWVSYGEYIWPCDGVITSNFGYRNISVGSTYHKGLDIASDLNSPIYASDGGEVIYAGEYYGYGLMVDIQHDNGDVTRYAHCESLGVSEGDKVARGDTIAYMGSTGVSTGVHLHFEIQTNGEAIDPVTKLP